MPRALHIKAPMGFPYPQFGRVYRHRGTTSITQMSPRSLRQEK
jgi:hypothetical protein